MLTAEQVPLLVELPAYLAAKEKNKDRRMRQFSLWFALGWQLGRREPEAADLVRQYVLWRYGVDVRQMVDELLQMAREGKLVEERR